MKQVLLGVALAGALVAQVPNPTQTGATGQTQVVAMDHTPLYTVQVVSKTTQAVNYRHRSGVTKIDFQGTALMPQAKGDAKVNSKQGFLEVNAHFKNLGQASQFGNEYLTYVLWAISPEGRSVNLGEVLLNSENDSKLDVTTELQAFGLIVTAEPYAAVTQPSDVVVMENIVRSDTKGQVENLDAKFELLQRGQYTYNVDKSTVRAVAMNGATPLELIEARNAVQIARWTGADKYAADSFKKAEDQLKQAEGYNGRKITKSTAMLARAASEAAEDARIIAIKRQDEERLAMERQASADREAKSRGDAESAARQRTQAEDQQKVEAARREQAEAQQKLAENQQKLAENQQKQAEEQQKMEAARRAQAEETARLETARASQFDQQRQEAEKAKAEAIAAQQQADRAKAEAEAARQAAVAQQQLAQQAAGESDRARMRAETDREELRKQLLQQFNMILETRDTARGLIVNMSDVLFDTGKYTLRQGTREKLARVAGILLAHPGLKIEVEGHTDAVGGDDYNQKLSESRANAVREYVITNGIAADNVTAKGFGKTTPVASNDTAAGRQMNRRVEMVVSGEIIGTKLGEIHTNYQPMQQPAPQR